MNQHLSTKVSNHCKAHIVHGLSYDKIHRAVNRFDDRTGPFVKRGDAVMQAVKGHRRFVYDISVELDVY